MHEITKKMILAFNKAAAGYEQVTPVQKNMGDKLISLLPTIFFQQVIDLGCGPGWTTQRLAHHIKFFEFEAIDIAEAMLMQAKARDALSKIQFKIGSFDQLAMNRYDLIFSNMALQWSVNFSMTLNHMYQALKPGGLLAFSLPLWQTFAELQPYYNVRHLHTMATVVELLQQKKFSLREVQHAQQVLIFDNTLQLLKNVKQTGATVCNTRSAFSYARCRLAIKKDLIKKLSYHVGLFIVEKI